MAPSVYGRVGSMSAVVHQPEGEQERQQALQALLSCPTYSIHASQRTPGELAAARDSIPVPVAGCRDVYHCGFHDEKSYGATPYLIRRRAQPSGSTGTHHQHSPAAAAAPAASGGQQQEPAAAGSGGGEGSQGWANIMVDVPRWNPSLAKRLEQLGGVRYIFLTHQDDVGDHAKWAAHFGATRIIHRLEVNRKQGTDKAEWQLEGEGPWEQLGPDVLLIFTPGHTPGCVSLLYQPAKALFTGDHLFVSKQDRARLRICREYNWHSVSQQLDSLQKLLQYDFLHVLPGHGPRTSYADPGSVKQALRDVLQAEGWSQPARAAAV
ncbi:hypothetical protein N2152v2_001856 [Parachlorella kessleri]